MITNIYYFAGLNRHTFRRKLTESLDFIRQSVASIVAFMPSSRFIVVELVVFISSQGKTCISHVTR